jgi:hypothetical protein
MAVTIEAGTNIFVVVVVVVLFGRMTLVSSIVIVGEVVVVIVGEVVVVVVVSVVVM